MNSASSRSSLQNLLPVANTPNLPETCHAALLRGSTGPVNESSPSRADPQISGRPHVGCPACQQSLPPRLLSRPASGDLVGNYIETPSWRKSMGKQAPREVGCCMLECGSRELLDALRLVVGDACQAFAILDSLCTVDLTWWLLPHCSSALYCPF